MTDDDADALDAIAERIGTVAESDGHLDPEDNAETGEQFGYDPGR